MLLKSIHTICVLGAGLSAVQAFEPIFDDQVGTDADTSQRDTSQILPPERPGGLRSVSAPIDSNADPVRVQVQKNANWQKCGYAAVPENKDLYNVGPATEISNSYPLPQRTYQQFQDGTFGSVDRIVNGDESSVHSWPWQVRVRPCSNWRCTFLCGGSIISEKWVLTAAHCIPYRANGGNITVGSHILWSDPFGVDPNAKNHSISSIVNHKGWNKYTRRNDITLIQVHKAFEFNSHVSPVCLPSEDSCINYGSACAVTGWGYTEKKKISPTLQELAVRLIPYETCRASMYYSGGVFPDQVCAGFAEGGKDSCSGDSGGPLVCKSSGLYNQYVLYGIVSWGYGCARQYKPGVYTRVTSFLPWIKETMHDNGSDGEYSVIGPSSPGVGKCMSCSSHAPGDCDSSIDITKSAHDGKPVNSWEPPKPTTTTKAPPTTTKAPAIAGNANPNQLAVDSNIDDTCGKIILSGVMTGAKQISTPNYPNNYPEGKVCLWTIGNDNEKDSDTKIITYLKINKADFGTTRCQKGSDKMEIICKAKRSKVVVCKSGPKTYSCPGPFTVKFVSNRDNKEFSGALMTYTIKEEKVNACGTTDVLEVGPQNTFSSSSLSLYPLPTSEKCNIKIKCPANTRCRLTISTRTRLGALERRNKRTKKTSLLKCYDRVDILDKDGTALGKVCGFYSYRNNRIFTASSNELNVNLDLDNRPGRADRFEAQISIIKNRG